MGLAPSSAHIMRHSGDIRRVYGLEIFRPRLGINHFNSETRLLACVSQ